MVYAVNQMFCIRLSYYVWFSYLDYEIVKKSVQSAVTSLRRNGSNWCHVSMKAKCHRGLYRSPRHPTVPLEQKVAIEDNGDFTPAEFKKTSLPIPADFKIQTRWFLGNNLVVYSAGLSRYAIS